MLELWREGSKKASGSANTVDSDSEAEGVFAISCDSASDSDEMPDLMTLSDGSDYNYDETFFEDGDWFSEVGVDEDFNLECSDGENLPRYTTPGARHT